MAKDEELSLKLRRLGVVKGARQLKPAPPPTPPAKLSHSASNAPDGYQPLATLLPGGYIEETAVGNSFILDHVYPLEHQHGRMPLNTLLQFQPGDTAVITNDDRFHDLTFHDVVFLDTETTGLGGAGTIAFMVGAAFFKEDAFIARQYFVPDFGDEAATLTLLDNLLAEKAALITFNGRTFDIPLLENRYLMNRLSTELRHLPHLDLLSPARRLWRKRLGSVALSALEMPILGVHRSQEDVPGWLIPSLYNQYIRTGNGRELVRVFYHNQIDLLSMVTLTAHVIRLFNRPHTDDDPIDLFSLGRWHAQLGLIDDAMQCLHWASQKELPLDLFHQTLYEQGWLLKRHGRRAEAVPLWQQIAATSFDDVTAHVELAKHYEWHDKDLTQAHQWTQQALSLVSTWRSPSPAAAMRDELTHRLNRLHGKIKKG